MNHPFHEIIRQAAGKKILFLPHAISQMSHPIRMISVSDIRKVISEGELIEEYPEDTRGHSALLWGTGENDRLIHVVCAPKIEYLAIITAYIPDPDQWSDNFKRRK